MIRLLVVGDIRLWAEALALHLSRSSRFGVMGVAMERATALAMAEDLAPDVVLLDMATADSLRLVRELRRVSPRTRVLALTIPEVEGTVLACAEAGIAGYVPRTGSLEDLVAAIEGAARDESIVSPRIAASLLRRVTALAAERASESAGALTAREVEIVRLIDQGCSNKQIAARLSIELSTVKNHVHNLLEKLGVQRRSEAAARLRRALDAAPLASVELEI